MRGRTAEPVTRLVPVSVPAPTVPDEGGRVLDPGPSDLLEPGADLVGALRLLTRERAPLENALDRLGHVEPAAAQGRVERLIGSQGRTPLAALPANYELHNHKLVYSLCQYA